MKYLVDLNSNGGFLQIFGMTEWGEDMEYPLSFQNRGGVMLAESLANVIDECLKKMKEIESGFHEDTTLRNQHELGFSIFKPGETPIVLVCKQRMISIMVGWTQLGDGPINSPDNLLKALRFTLQSDKNSSIIDNQDGLLQDAEREAHCSTRATKRPGRC